MFTLFTSGPPKSVDSRDSTWRQGGVSRTSIVVRSSEGLPTKKQDRLGSRTVPGKLIMKEGNGKIIGRQETLNPGRSLTSLFIGETVFEKMSE